MMTDKEKDLLAGYHHTISEQLNARLSESPKFFWVLIAVSAAYGYVMLNQPDKNKPLFVLVSLLVYLVILWANWYLAALGYAFRYLQNIQHCAEHALDWSPRFAPHSGEQDSSAFWLLPSIYHPHAFGLLAFLLIDCGAFWYYSLQFWPTIHWYIALTALVFGLFGSLMVYISHSYYRCKFRKARRRPEECNVQLQ